MAIVSFCLSSFLKWEPWSEIQNFAPPNAAIRPVRFFTAASVSQRFVAISQHICQNRLRLIGLFKCALAEFIHVENSKVDYFVRRGSIIAWPNTRGMRVEPFVEAQSKHLAQKGDISSAIRPVHVKFFFFDIIASYSWSRYPAGQQWASNRINYLIRVPELGI